MLRLFTRNLSTTRKTLFSHIPKVSPSFQISNEQLKGSKLFDVSHVTALVTGGGTGIGLMITQALVANGAKVYITSRREEVLKKTEELYSAGPGEIIPLVADVSNKEDILRLYEEVEKKEPKGIQLLVNNAGIARDDATKYRAPG
jgi:NAD(P)-dependent dehydrogenase (short-subunit alcohol dehydrogenase family)